LEISYGLPEIGCRPVDRRIHVSAPASIRTASETRMYDMIPLTDAAWRTEGCELSMNKDIPPPLTLPAVVHKGSAKRWSILFPS